MRYNFDDVFLDELRMKNDIETIIGEHVELRKRGHIFTGLCPFHNEKTPSFTVYPDTQSFYCYGCGAGGEVITFTRKFYNLDFIEAVKLLAEKSGLALPAVGGDDGAAKLRRLVLEANRDAARFFHETLQTPKGQAQLNYLYGREISDKMIVTFGLGAAPDEWQGLYDHLRGKGYSDEILVAANLVRKSVKNNRTNYYDQFRNKVMFPIIDVRGNVVAFGSRVMDNSKPKYINSSDTPVYKKTNEIYALNLAKNKNEGELILCEGYMDVIALHAAGFNNAVAGLGTALTSSQVGLISRYADRVALCYDSDDAGRKATEKALALFSETGVKTKVINLPEGKDPDDIIKKQGKERFRALLESSANDIEYKLSLERQKYDTKTADGKVSFLKAAAAILAVNAGAIERDVYASRLADELEVNKDAILQQIKGINIKNERIKQKNAIRDAEKDKWKVYEAATGKNKKDIRIIKAEEILLANIISSPSFLSKLSDKLSRELFITPVYIKAFSAISERIKNNKPIEITYISENFEPSEMGVVSRLYMGGIPVSNTLKECEDCIKVLTDEKGKKELGYKEVSQLSDDDFLSLFNNDKK